MNSLTFSKGFKGPNLSAILNGPVFAINQRIAQPLLIGARKIVNPRAGVNAGDDRVPAPAPDESRESAGELLDVAAMVLLRETPLDEIDSNPTAARIAETLSQFPGLLTVPGAAGLWRYGPLDNGARLSRLVDASIPLGWRDTLYWPEQRNGNYGATADAYNALQAGNVIERQSSGPIVAPHTGRGIASLVHQDQPFLIPLFVACQLLGANAPLSSRFPAMANEVPFITGGGALALQCALATATESAMRLCWRAKYATMRERPERLWREGVAGNLHPDFLNLGGWIVEEVGDYLPMIYAEGSPIHPDYPSGHACIAGVCGGILMAWFSDAPVPALGIQSVHAEIRQMMWAMAIGRNWAGIHTRSSLLEGLRLGIRQARVHLATMKAQNPEPLRSTSFVDFDGLTVSV
jgi:hypothetical protein